MNIIYEKAKVKILAWSMEDWIDLYFFSSIINEYYNCKNSELLKKTTLKFVKDVLEKNLMKAGDLLKGNVFKVWDKDINETLQEIQKKWNNLKRNLYPQEIVWFDITEKGKKEFEYLNTLPELQKYVHYFRICEGGKKAAKELLNKMTKGATLIKDDRLRKIKVYKLLDNTQFSYREFSKFGIKMITIDVKFSGIKKYLQFQFKEK